MESINILGQYALQQAQLLQFNQGIMARIRQHSALYQFQLFRSQVGRYRRPLPLNLHPTALGNAQILALIFLYESSGQRLKVLVQMLHNVVSEELACYPQCSDPAE